MSHSWAHQLDCAVWRTLSLGLYCFFWFPLGVCILRSGRHFSLSRCSSASQRLMFPSLHLWFRSIVYGTWALGRHRSARSRDSRVVLWKSSSLCRPVLEQLSSESSLCVVERALHSARSWGSTAASKLTSCYSQSNQWRLQLSFQQFPHCTAACWGWLVIWSPWHREWLISWPCPGWCQRLQRLSLSCSSPLIRTWSWGSDAWELGLK